MSLITLEQQAIDARELLSGDYKVLASAFHQEKIFFIAIPYEKWSEDEVREPVFVSISRDSAPALDGKYLHFRIWPNKNITLISEEGFTRKF